MSGGLGKFSGEKLATSCEKVLVTEHWAGLGLGNDKGPTVGIGV